MTDRTNRRWTLIALALVAMVGTAGCIDASGYEDGDPIDDLYAGSTAQQTNETATAEQSSTTDDGATTAEQSTEDPPSADDSETPDESPTTAEPVTTEDSPPTTTEEDPCLEYLGHEPEGPQRGEIVSDDSICVVSHDIKPFDGFFGIGGTLTNPTDRTLDHVHVEITVYDDDGEVIAHEVVCVNDVGPGDSAGYSVDFYEAQGVAYEDHGSYRVHAYEG